MAINLSIPVRNGRLDQIESLIAAPSLIIFSGAKSVSCADPDPTGPLVTVPMGSDWMNAAANGIKTIAGAPWTAAASATGNAASFRIKNSGGTCHIQGTVGTTGADLILDNVSLNAGQTVNVTVFTLTDGNA